MSFVKKAVKKVFKFHKRLFKKTKSFVKRAVKSKWFKIVAIIALSVFTAGLAAGGFAAFGAASAAAGGGIGGFFSAVGSTMATGWTAITSSVTGMFSGGAAQTAAAGQPLMTAGLEGTGGLLGSGAAAGANAAGTGVLAAEAASTGALAASSASGFVAPLASNVGTALTGGAATQAAGAGFWGASKGVLSKFGSLLMDKGLAGTALRGGIVQGINMWSQNAQMEKQEEYFRNRTVWGGPAFGGTSEPMSFLRPAADQSAAQMAATTMPTQTPQQVQAEQLAAMAATSQGQLPGASQGQSQGLLAAATPQQQAGAMDQPMQNQPPPATNPQQSSPGGLLQLETAGVYA